jgi:hypothetical protein
MKIEINDHTIELLKDARVTPIQPIKSAAKIEGATFANIWSGDIFTSIYIITKLTITSSSRTIALLT